MSVGESVEVHPVVKMRRALKEPSSRLTRFPFFLYLFFHCKLFSSTCALKNIAGKKDEGSRGRENERREYNVVCGIFIFHALAARTLGKNVCNERKIRIRLCYLHFKGMKRNARQGKSRRIILLPRPSYVCFRQVDRCAASSSAS